MGREVRGDLAQRLVRPRHLLRAAERRVDRQRRRRYAWQPVGRTVRAVRLREEHPVRAHGRPRVQHRRARDRPRAAIPQLSRAERRPPVGQPRLGRGDRGGHRRRRPRGRHVLRPGQPPLLVQHGSAPHRRQLRRLAPLAGRQLLGARGLCARLRAAASVAALAGQRPGRRGWAARVAAALHAGRVAAAARKAGGLHAHARRPADGEARRARLRRGACQHRWRRWHLGLAAAPRRRRCDTGSAAGVSVRMARRPFQAHRLSGRTRRRTRLADALAFRCRGAGVCRTAGQDLRQSRTSRARAVDALGGGGSRQDRSCDNPRLGQHDRRLGRRRDQAVRELSRVAGKRLLSRKAGARAFKNRSTLASERHRSGSPSSTGCNAFAARAKAHLPRLPRSTRCSPKARNSLRSAP